MAPCNKSICVQDWDSDLVVLHGLFISSELCELTVVLQKGECGNAKIKVTLHTASKS